MRDFFILIMSMFAVVMVGFIFFVQPIFLADKVEYTYNYLDEFNTLEERYNILSDKYLLLQETKKANCEYKQPSFNYYGMLFSMVIGMFGMFYIRDILGWKFVKENKKNKPKGGK